MSATRISRRIKAPRASVYRALLDPNAIPGWRVPEGMTCQVHTFDAREGGTLRVSPADNELGWAQALEKLAAQVEAGS
jgi:uncharacterized protein YndB with AHSA1/START domain